MKTVKCFEYVTKDELLLALSKKGNFYYLLGEDSINKQKFYLIPLWISIGVITDWHGVRPMCIEIEKGALIGYNFYVDMIDTDNRVNRIVQTTSVFFEFVFCEMQNVTIAVFETSVFGISAGGKLLWESDFDDIITGYEIVEGLLKISKYEGESAFIAICNGEIKQF